jgi:archaellum biogenesis protein FlaJ (TadC family)
MLQPLLALALTYLPVYCQVAVVLGFSLSFAGKVRNVPAFVRTITSFRVLPARHSGLLAALFLCAEFAVVLLVLLGSTFTLAGLALAALLLVIFTVALILVLVRGVDASCNCFGASDDKISPYHILRNLLFLTGTLLAMVPFFVAGVQYRALTPPEWLLTWLMAIVSVAILTNLPHIARVLRPD